MLAKLHAISSAKDEGVSFYSFLLCINRELCTASFLCNRPPVEKMNHCKALSASTATQGDTDSRTTGTVLRAPSRTGYVQSSHIGFSYLWLQFGSD
jgi:hypothetical protein